MKSLIIIIILFLTINIIYSQDYKTVKVSNEVEFIQAINSNTIIDMEPGEYNISKATSVNNINIYWEDDFDGKYPIITNVYNLTLKGIKGVKVLIKPRYAFVLSFENCSNIKIHKIFFGHTVGGYCSGGVLGFSQTDSVLIENSILYGSGTTGLDLSSVDNFNFINSTIKECTSELMKIKDSKNINFYKSTFKDTKEFSLINIQGYSSDIGFDYCVIKNNVTGTYEPYLFNIDQDCTNITLENSKIIDNDVLKFVNDESKIKLYNNFFSDNKFDKSK